MKITEQDSRILSNVVKMLGSGKALSQHLEDYVVGFGVLGRLVAIAQGEAENLEQDRKIEWAKAFSAAKQREGKVTNQEAEIEADLAVDPIRREEIKARESLTKLKGMRETVQEAVWAIKSLDRNGG